MKGEENHGSLRRIYLVIFFQQLCIVLLYYFFASFCKYTLPINSYDTTSFSVNQERVVFQQSAESITKCTSANASNPSRRREDLVSFVEDAVQLPLCSVNTSDLGPLDTVEMVSQLMDWNLVDDYHLMKRLTESGFSYGGHSRPPSCRPSEKVAIIVPYRNRPEQLDIFVRYMHPFLQKQQLEYKIFIIEQNDTLPFNRGTLLNIGYVEAINEDSTFDCFIFHDVDMLPEDGRNMYSCPKEGKPRQLAFMVDLWDYVPIVREYAGGVTAMGSKDFMRINGYANSFWGWGSEDDDLYRRIVTNNMSLVRMSDEDPSLIEQTKYRTIYHRSEKANPDRFIALEKGGGDKMLSDGLVSLDYKRKAKVSKLYYTHVFVELIRIE